MVRLSNFLRVALVAVFSTLLGAASGLITVGFIKALKWLQHVIWTTTPEILDISSTSAIYIVLTCTIGGLLIGFGAKYLGNYPKGLTEAIADVKQGKPSDYRHIPQSIVNSLLSLGFGTALGPEAALTTIAGGLGTWVSQKIRFLSVSKDELRSISLGGTLGVLFGSPLASAYREPRHILEELCLIHASD
jgi:H+/Cl- antiporter ClcA